MTSLKTAATALRLPKTLPIALIPACGACLSSTKPPIWPLVAMTLLTVFGGFLATVLNNRTDSELDRSTKPELASSTVLIWPRLRLGVIVGLIAPGAGMLIVACSETQLSMVFFCLALALGVQYSFNVFSFSPRTKRWKTRWYLSALSILGAYWSLGMAGYSLTPVSVAGAIEVLGFSMGEYAYYLVETTGDWREERAAGLRTLPALCGVGGTLWVSGLLLVCSLSLCFFLWLVLSMAVSTLVIAALRFAVFVFVIAPFARCAADREWNEFLRRRFDWTYPGFRSAQLALSLCFLAFDGRVS